MNLDSLKLVELNAQELENIDGGYSTVMDAIVRGVQTWIKNWYPF